MNKPTLVLGASTNPARYSHRAIEMLREEEHEVLALGLRTGEVQGVHIQTDPAELANKEVDTLTLYLNPKRQEAYKSWIKTLAPKRVIFNPGTENPAFAQELEAAGIEPVFACTLVMLRTGQY